jgi:hypothetical protein
MYKLTLILFAFFTLVLPILAVPVPASDEIDGLEKRTTFTGRVRVIYSHPAHDADLSARREPGMNLALVIVVNTTPRATSSSLFPRKSMLMEPIAEGCGSSLSPNMPVLMSFCRVFR